MSDNNLFLDATSFLSETSEHLLSQDGGMGLISSASDAASGGIMSRVTMPLAIGCCITVMIMCISLICAIHNKSMCK